MIQSDDHRSDCLARARMHDQLAAATHDAVARQVHQAMATAFRRRAEQGRDSDVPRPRDSSPVLEAARALF